MQTHNFRSFAGDKASDAQLFGLSERQIAEVNETQSIDVPQIEIVADREEETVNTARSPTTIHKLEGS